MLNDLKKGELIVFAAPSGAGKSTFLKLIFCAEMPTSGQLLVHGHNTSNLRGNSIPYLRRNIGVVFQDDEDGEVCFHVQISILEEDLDEV